MGSTANKTPGIKYAPARDRWNKYLPKPVCAHAIGYHMFSGLNFPPAGWSNVGKFNQRMPLLNKGGRLPRQVGYLP